MKDKLNRGAVGMDEKRSIRTPDIGWFERMDREAKTEILMLSGSLNLPVPGDFARLSDFLHTVRGKIGESGSLATQLNRILNPELVLEICGERK